MAEIAHNSSEISKYIVRIVLTLIVSCVHLCGFEKWRSERDNESQSSYGNSWDTKHRLLAMRSSKQIESHGRYGQIRQQLKFIFHFSFYFLHYFLVLVDSVPANGICIAHSIHVQLYIVDSVDVSLLHGMGSIGRPLFNGSRQFPVNAFRQHSTLLCTTRDLIAIPTVGTFDNCNACVCFARRSTEDPVIELHRWTDRSEQTICLPWRSLLFIIAVLQCKRIAIHTHAAIRLSESAIIIGIDIDIITVVVVDVTWFLFSFLSAKGTWARCSFMGMPKHCGNPSARCFPIVKLKYKKKSNNDHKRLPLFHSMLPS